MSTRNKATTGGGMLSPVTNSHPLGAAPRTSAFRPYSTPAPMQPLRDRALVDQKATLLSLDARAVAPKDAK